MKTKRFFAGLMACGMLGSMAVPSFAKTSAEKNAAFNFYTECGILVQENWSDDFSSNPSTPFQMKRLIVQANSSDFDANQFGATDVVEGLNNLYVLQFASVAATETAFNAIQSNDYVEYVEADQFVEVSGQVGASASVEKPYNLSWGKERINTSAFTDYLIDRDLDTNVLVAVVDTGIDDYTADFRNKMSYDGYDFIEDDDEPQDENGHGTHVAGIIADVTHYFTDIDLYGVKVLNSDGEGSLLNLVNGISYAADQAADVIDCGVTISTIESQYLDNALNELNDTTVVAGIGDAHKKASNYYSNTLIVSSMSESNAIASNSNYGDVVDFTAPGENVLCADLNNNHVYFSGSDAAAAHVAAAAALMIYEDCNLTTADISRAFDTEAITSNDWDSFQGYGLAKLPQK